MIRQFSHIFLVEGLTFIINSKNSNSRRHSSATDPCRYVRERCQASVNLNHELGSGGWDWCRSTLPWTG